MAYSNSELDTLGDFAAACDELIRLTDQLHADVAKLGGNVLKITDAQIDTAQDTATAAMAAISTFLALSEAIRPKTQHTPDA